MVGQQVESWTRRVAWEPWRAWTGEKSWGTRLSCGRAGSESGWRMMGRDGLAGLVGGLGGWKAWLTVHFCDGHYSDQDTLERV